METAPASLEGKRRLPLPSSAHLIAFCLAWAVLTTTAVLLITWQNRVVHAVVSMGTGLLVVWVLLGGALMRRYREPVRRFVLGLPGRWGVKFVLFCTLMALLEEAVTTTMTNLAPLFGVPVGKAYITASSNYLDVVLGHSVIVFVPMYIAWAWMLSRWEFHPNVVLLLYGVTGVLAEAGTFGLQNLGMFGFWILVYGLMVYLPAYSLPERPAAKPAGARHYLLAVFLPFVAVIPVAGPVHFLHPVDIHFPPIQA